MNNEIEKLMLMKKLCYRNYYYNLVMHNIFYMVKDIRSMFILILDRYIIYYNCYFFEYIFVLKCILTFTNFDVLIITNNSLSTTMLTYYLNLVVTIHVCDYKITHSLSNNLFHSKIPLRFFPPHL